MRPNKTNFVLSFGDFFGGQNVKERKEEKKKKKKKRKSKGMEAMMILFGKYGN